MGSLFAIALAFAPAAAAGLKPDFAQVKTRAAAEALVAQGQLVRVLIFPTELGGHDDAENVAYITPEAAAARKLVIGTLRRMVAAGTIDHMDVEPTYRGRSVVPTSIRLHASGANGGSFDPTIEIW